MNAPNTGKRPQSQNQNSVHAPIAVNQKAAVGPSQTHSIRYTTADNPLHAAARHRQLRNRLNDVGLAAAGHHQLALDARTTAIILTGLRQLFVAEAQARVYHR